MTDATLTWLAPVTCFGGTVLMIVAGVFFILRQKKARRANLARLGFSPYPPAALPALAARVERIYRHRTSQRLKLNEPYHRPIEDGELALFDLVDTAATENAQLGSNLLGVASPRLNLPYFAILPWSGGQGDSTGGLASFAASAALNVVDWAMRQAGLQKISIPAADDFNRDFTVYAKDQPAVFDFFTPDRIEALRAIGRRYELQASGDFFTIKMGLGDSRQTITFTSQPDIMLADAARLLAIFAG